MKISPAAQRDVDALFLDVREPWVFLDHAWAALKGSGFFGTLVPTTDQVSTLLEGLEELPFGISVEEVFGAAVQAGACTAPPGGSHDRAQRIPWSSPRRIAAGDASLSWMPEKKRRAYLGKQAMAQTRGGT